MSNVVEKKLPLLIIIVFTAVLWLPNLFTRGMFIDGMLYGIIANNLAHGIGSWWNLQGVPTMDYNFFGNPPFHIWILSLFYSLLGYGFWTDHCYSFITAVITLLLIFFCSKEINFIKNRKNDNWWLACLSWLLFIPVIPWSYSNNLMENTMTVFSTLAVLFVLQYIRKDKNIILFAFLSSVCIFIAFLTKGLPALFPLVAPLCLLKSKEFFTLKKALTFTLLHGLLFIVLALLVFSQKAPSIFLHNYINVQLMPVLQQQYNNTDNRFFIIVALLKAIILPLLILLMLMLMQRAKGLKPETARPNLGVLLIALSASLPIIISLKQASYYLLPSLPFYALFLGNLVTPFIEQIKIPATIKKVINLASITALIVSVIFCVALAGKNGRDSDLQNDLKNIASIVGSEKVISSGTEIQTEWSLKAYLFRDYKITDESLSNMTQHSFLIRKIDTGSTPVTYRSVYRGQQLELFEKQSK